MLTRPIATTAHAAPASAIADGVRSVTRPMTIGTSAPVTAVIGATIAIAPVESPR